MIPGMITGSSAYIVSTLIASGKIQMKYLVLLVPLIVVIMITELYRKEKKPFDSLAHTFFSVLYTALPFSLFPFSAFSHDGLDALLPTGITTFSPGIVVGFFL